MIETYLDSLRARRLSPKTIDLYKVELNTLKRLGRDKIAIANHLSQCGAATHQRKLITWKAYLKTIEDPLLNEFRSPKVCRKQMSFLNEIEIQKVQDYAKQNLSNQDNLFIKIGISLGLRISEILQLNKNNLDGDWILIKRKGGHEQRIPLTEELALELQSFEGFIYQKRYYQNLMKRLGKILNLNKKFTPHTLRHSFATRAISENNDIATLQEVLGHSSIQSTERYLHVTPQRLMKLIQRSSK